MGFCAGEKVPCCFFIGIDSKGWSRRVFRLAAGGGRRLFLLAKLGLQLASINPSASPIWAPTGLAFAAVILGGVRFFPAILIGAFAANATTAGTLETSAAIAVGNTLEGVVGGYLIAKWCGGAQAFVTPARIAKFAIVCAGLPTMLSATIGVATLYLAGFAAEPNFAPVWITWWLGDTAGALVVTPVIVLWAVSDWRAIDGRELRDMAAVFGCAILVGLITFSPLLPRSEYTSPLGFLAILPLVWAALRRGPRDTATVAVILTIFAIWATIAQVGPFAQLGLNESFLLLLTFMLSVSVPSLALSADVEMRRRSEDDLRRIQAELDQRVKDRTAALADANLQLGKANSQLADANRQLANTNTQLADANIQLSEAQRLANLGSWSWDVAKNRISWSDQLYGIYGLARGEFGGTFADFLTLIHPDDRAHVQTSMTHALKSGRDFSHEERIIRGDGLVRHLHSVGEVVRDEDGAAVRMLGVCLDVTERKQAETALRESEQNVRMLLTGVRDYAIYMLDLDGHVRSWNAGAEQIKGYSADEIVGQHFRQFYTEEDRAQNVPEDALVTAVREGKYEAEGWLVRKDGSRFYANELIETIRDDAGELAGFAKITRDITAQHEAQIALDETREQLAQAQKMEALGQLTGGIAHDFNNLLMIVSGYAQILQRKLSEPKDVQAVDAIRAAASRGEKLTRQLLTFSRRQQLMPVVVDLHAHIGAVRDMLAPSLRGNIELVVDIEDKIWPVEVDLGELELALVNIAVNARDAMPEGGTITLQARNVVLTPGTAAGALEGDFVALAIIDTGTRHPGGCAAEGVRAVLHDEAGRQGHRARALAGARFCQPIRRSGDGRKRAGPWHRCDRLSAASAHGSAGGAGRRGFDGTRERSRDCTCRRGQPRCRRRDIRVARAARIPRGAGRKCRRGAASPSAGHRIQLAVFRHRHAGHDGRAWPGAGLPRAVSRLACPSDQRLLRCGSGGRRALRYFAQAVRALCA